MINYGIEQENSDLRAHVCVVNKSVYVYSRRAGIAAIEKGESERVSGYQPGVGHATSEGYLVRPWDIQGCQRVDIPVKLLAAADFREDDSTTNKGVKAAFVVGQMLKMGLFPLPVEGEDVSDAVLQIQGTDIVVQLSARIQVKCDWYGGFKNPQVKTTGFLFLQVAERNPLRRH